MLLQVDAHRMLCCTDTPPTFHNPALMLFHHKHTTARLHLLTIKLGHWAQAPCHPTTPTPHHEGQGCLRLPLPPLPALLILVGSFVLCTFAPSDRVPGIQFKHSPFFRIDRMVSNVIECPGIYSTRSINNFYPHLIPQNQAVRWTAGNNPSRSTLLTISSRSWSPRGESSLA